MVDNHGKPIYPRAAITVVDLDGRLNLNTHGSQVDVDSIVSGTSSAYPLISSAGVSSNTNGEYSTRFWCRASRYFIDAVILSMRMMLHLVVT